jgi:hypothetical protein
MGAMAQIYVNDVPQPVDAPPPTWGDLLASLDEQAAAHGFLLTTARFDGVDEPSFRDPQVTARRLTEVERVDVETATPAAFLRQCLLDSVRPLHEAADMAGRLSAIYRQHDVTRGHEGLTTLAMELRGLTALVSMLGGPLQIDLSFVNGRTTAADQMDELGAALDALVTAQESEDWLTVADVLEYDLEPAIRRWIELLTILAKRM